MLIYNTKKNSKKLYDSIFKEKEIFNKLIIITGYIGPSIVNDLNNLHYDNVEIYIGMYGKKIALKLHNSLLKSQIDNEKLKIYYTNIPVHSKLYCWYKDNSLEEVLMGSANFSNTALLFNYYREVLQKPSIITSTSEYIETIKEKAYLSSDLNISESLLFPVREVNKTNETTLLSFLANRRSDSFNIIGKATSMGDIHSGSGINWGYSNGLPLLGDAYIPLSSENIENAKNLFPEKSEENIPIEVLWDDGTTMTMLLEGNRKGSNNILYPKQISTFKNKSELGIYLRTRIGEKINRNLVFTEEEVNLVKEIKKEFKKNKTTFEEELKNFSGLKTSLNSKFITKSMLEEYGKTNIEIKVLEDNIYYFDFSVNNGGE